MKSMVLLRLRILKFGEIYRIIFTNTLALVSTQAITSAFGFLFWWAVAHYFTAEVVGLASAEISAMTLLGSIAVLGFGTMLVGELPKQQGHEISLITTSLIIVSISGIFLGIIFAILSPLISVDLGVLGQNPSTVLLFALGVAFTSMTNILDQSLIGLLRATLQLWRNLLFASIKLLVVLLAPLLLVFNTPGIMIYTTWSSR